MNANEGSWTQLYRDWRDRAACGQGTVSIVGASHLREDRAPEVANVVLEFIRRTDSQNVVSRQDCRVRDERDALALTCGRGSIPDDPSSHALRGLAPLAKPKGGTSHDHSRSCS